MPLDAQGFRVLMRSEAESLLSELDRVQDEEWSLATACPDWDALDVLTHLKLGVELHARMVQNSLDGAMRSPWDLPADVNPTAAFRQIHLDTRANGPAENLRALGEAVERYLGVLDGVDDASLEQPAWFFGMDATLRFLLTARAFDLVVHAADIRRAVGIDPWFSPAGARFAGEVATDRLPNFFRPDLAGGITGKILHTVDGVSSQAELDGTSLKMVAPDGQHNASIKTDGGTWALLTWKRMSLRSAVDQGLASTGGDIPLLERYLSAFRTP